MRKTTKAKREEIHARLEEIRASHGGVLTPNAVLRDAKREDSVLHDQFDWDTQRAAHRHWLDTARELIRSYTVVVTTQSTKVVVPYYLENPEKARGTQGYRATLELRSESDLAREALVDEFSRAANLLRRARMLALAFDLENEVDVTIEKVETMRTELIAGAQIRQ